MRVSPMKTNVQHGENVKLFPHLFPAFALDTPCFHPATTRNLPGSALASNTIPACSNIHASIFS